MTTAVLEGVNTQPDTPSPPTDLQMVGNREDLTSNGGAWYESPSTGERFYAKEYPDPNQARVEFITNSIYRLAGARTVESQLVDTGGRLAVVSREIPGLAHTTLDEQQASSEVQDSFVTSAYLANWDVVGLQYDNIMRDTTGHHILVDNGGSLIFRASRGTKPFPADSIAELDTMRDARYPAGRVFQRLDEPAMRAQAQSLTESVSPSAIEHIIAESGLTGEAEQVVREGLLGRRQFLVDRFNLSDPHANELSPLEFAPTDADVLSYPDGHPAMTYLRRLIPDTLTAPQQQALHNYAGNTGHQALLQSLERGEEPQMARDIDDAMVQSRLPQPTVVYHAAGNHDGAAKDIQDGTVFEEQNYMSTTLNFTLATYWLHSDTIMRIELPAGTPVAVPDISEAELLLARGSRYEITGKESVTIQTGGSDREITLLHVRQLPGSKAIEEAEARLAATSLISTDKTEELPSSTGLADPFFADHSSPTTPAEAETMRKRRGSRRLGSRVVASLVTRLRR